MRCILQVTIMVCSLFCQLPVCDIVPEVAMDWARKKEKEVDVFIIITDMSPHIDCNKPPSVALKEYRTAMNKKDAW